MDPQEARLFFRLARESTATVAPDYFVISLKMQIPSAMFVIHANTITASPATMERPRFSDFLSALPASRTFSLRSSREWRVYAGPRFTAEDSLSCPTYK
jgi:hypothetical protein